MKNLIENLIAQWLGTVAALLGMKFDAKSCAIFWRRFLLQLEAWGTPSWGAHVIPSLAELQQYNVNRPDAVEAVKQSLYDSIVLTSSSTQSQLQFFQVPQGQGTSPTIGSGVKNLADTNMEAAGSLPAPKSFLVQTIELFIFPQNSVSTDGTTAAANKNMLDMYKVSQGGWLNLFIGSKSYLTEAPLLKFPPRSGLTGNQSLGDDTANTITRVDYVSMGGPVYELDPWVLLVPTQNFIVTLNWQTALANLNANVLIYVNLGGILYRNSQ